MSGSIGPVPYRVNKKTEDVIIDYTQKMQSLLMVNFNLRTVLQNIDLAYIRESNWTGEQAINRAFNAIGDSSKIQDVTVPIVMPQVEAALGYMVEVFLSGEPIFAINGSPAVESVAKQYEAILAENCATANWKRQIIMFFRDGLKYNLHALEVSWDKKTLASVTSDVNYPNGAKPKDILWQGNTLKRIDLYNAFWDPRCSPADVFEKGDFAGYNEFYSRTRLKQYLNSLGTEIPAHVISRAMESSFSGSPTNSMGYQPFSYFTPLVNPDPLIRNDKTNTYSMDWMSWAENKAQTSDGLNYGSGYIVTKMYARIIPSDMGIEVPASNTPQVWKFIIINGKVVVRAERQSNVHGYIPILFGQPIEDGLDYQTKSFATNVKPMQEIATGMLTAWTASKRRLVSDRVLYDPMRIKASDINSTNPAAKIPVRPSAMGTAVKDSVYPFPFHDEATDSLVQGSQLITNYANLINGQNPAQQGQFVKGNKTLKEYDDVMGHGNSRNQGMAIMTETQVFVPAKKILMLNILQFQAPATITNPTDGTQQDIQPQQLRDEVVAFKVSDGLTPSEKMMNTGTWNTAIQAIASSEQIGQAYQIGPMFSYLMNQQDVDLSPFEKSPQELQYEQQMQAWQQAAANAAKAGTAFNSPMPQPPAPPPAATSQGPGGNIPNATTSALQPPLQGNLLNGQAS